MIRILIDGDPPHIRQLEDWLANWGMLALPLPRAAGHPAAQPRAVTDAVVVHWGDTLLDPGSAPLAGAEDAAPLILVGGDRAPAALRNAAAALVATPGPDGGRLREALRYCLERDLPPLTSRPVPPPRAGFQGTLQFFNHELRTPLTAATVALQAAARGLEPRAECAPELALLDRALRNLKRLQRTVDWAGDFVQGTVAAADGEPISVLADLLEDLDELDAPVDLTWEADADWTCGVEVGRELWRRVLRQIAQAVHFFRPDASAHVVVGGDAAGGEPRLVVRVVVRRRDAGPGAVNRTGLTDPVDAADELRRLLGFTISPGLLPAIRAELRVEDGEPPVVNLALPVAASPVVA